MYSPVLKISNQSRGCYMNYVCVSADVTSILLVCEGNLMFKTSAKLATLKSQPPPLSTENALQWRQQCL